MAAGQGNQAAAGLRILRWPTRPALHGVKLARRVALWPVVRSYLTLLLLLNYLLVVGAGAVERPARRIERPFAYVHSADCQLRHTLRVACFDDCNGVQYTVQKRGERLPLTHLLASLKGVDAHCLPESGRVAFAPSHAGRAAPRPAAYAARVPPGYRGQVEQPPRRG